MNKKAYESDKLSCVICGVDKENRPTLFKLPSSPDRKGQWMAILNIKSIKRRSRLCQRHFSNDQFVHTRLKKDAIPNVPSPPPGVMYPEVNTTQHDLSGYVKLLPKPE